MTSAYDYYFELFIGEIAYLCLIKIFSPEVFFFFFNLEYISQFPYFAWLSVFVFAC